MNKKIVAGVLASTIVLSAVSVPVSAMQRFQIRNLNNRGLSSLTYQALNPMRYAQLTKALTTGVEKGTFTKAEANMLKTKLTCGLYNRDVLKKIIDEAKAEAQADADTAKNNVDSVVKKAVDTATTVDMSNTELATIKLNVLASVFLDASNILKANIGQYVETVNLAILNATSRIDPANIDFLTDIILHLCANIKVGVAAREDTESANSVPKNIQIIRRKLEAGVGSDNLIATLASFVKVASNAINAETNQEALSKLDEAIGYLDKAIEELGKEAIAEKARIERAVRREYIPIALQLSLYKAQYKIANAKIKLLTEIEQFLGLKDK